MSDAIIPSLIVSLPATTILGNPTGSTGAAQALNAADARTTIGAAAATDLAAKADLVGGTVPSSQLPSYVDDVLEYANLAAFPATGETGKIYIAIDTGSTYRWSGSVYVQLASAASSIAAETILGNPTGSTAASQAMTRATFLSLLGSLISGGCSQTEPTTSKTVWVSNGTLKITPAIAPVGTVAISSTEIAVGDSVTITYTQSSGTIATAFQLRKGGANVGSSQGTGVFTLTNQQTSDTGTYDVVATNDIGAAASTNTVALSVVAFDRMYRVNGTGRYAVANGSGLAGLGSFRIVFQLLSVPTSGLQAICGRMGASAGQGWYLFTGGSAGAGGLAINHNGNGAISPIYTFTTADIGRVFVVHGTYRGGRVRLYIGGSEVGIGTTASAPVTETAAGFSILDLSAGGYNTTNVSVISVALSSSSMTADQIHDDARTIQASATYFAAESLPSQTDRYDAVDLVANAASWASRGGSVNLTRTGSTTVTGPL